MLCSALSFWKGEILQQTWVFWGFFLVLMGCCWNMGCVWQEMCCGVSDCTTERNSRQWWVIFNRLPCGHLVGSRGLCWGVSCSIACSCFGWWKFFSVQFVHKGFFFRSVKRISLGDACASKQKLRWSAEVWRTSLNLPVLHLGAALWWRRFTTEAGWGPAMTR